MDSTLSMKRKKSKATDYYPIFFNIRSKTGVVVGGGKVAFRKVKILLDCGAEVTVVSPKPCPEIVKLSKDRLIRLIRRDYEAGDLRDAVIAIVCTDMKKVNRKVADEAKKAGVLVNVADDLEPSDFIIPSFFRRGNLTIAVSTSGVSPALARKIRAKLEKSFGEEYGSLLSIIREVRSTIKEKGIIVDVEEWQDALDLDLLIGLVQAGQGEKAKVFLLDRLRASQKGR
jgi:precorrin-2 dehydrogenase/sirohydrochlorin ferrochelatase